MVRRLRMRPLPWQSGQGWWMILPVPRHFWQGPWLCMTPKGVRWAWVTVPVPRQSGHTSGVVPWAQPLPLQVGQDSLRSTVTDFSQPKAASVTGGFVALALACRGLLEQGLVKAMPIRHYVAGISAGIVDNVPMLDLQYSEDSRAMVDLNCVMNEQGGIIELQGTGEGRAFTAREQQELVALCAQGNARLIQLEKNILGEIL